MGLYYPPTMKLMMISIYLSWDCLSRTFGWNDSSVTSLADLFLKCLVAKKTRSWATASSLTYGNLKMMIIKFGSTLLFQWSKVVSTHLWNTPLYQQAMRGFLSWLTRGFAWGVLYGCVVIFLEMRIWLFCHQNGLSWGVSIDDTFKDLTAPPRPLETVWEMDVSFFVFWVWEV